MHTLRLRFPGGRYHATPPGHHVNEAQVEWPPSPWRLMRALLACGYTTQGWVEGPPPAAQRLFEALSEELPSYHLPRVSLAHSRHYMPLGILKDGLEKTTLVYDAWAHVGAGVVDVHWPVTLDEEARGLLGVLAQHLGYLGRSESWVEGKLLAEGAQTLRGGYTVAPLTGALPQGHQRVALWAAQPAPEYADWRAAAIEPRLAELPLPEGKKKPTQALLKARAKACEPFPEDLLACLQLETIQWKKLGWSSPPGSRVVHYARSEQAMSVSPARPPRHISPAPVQAMLLSLSAPSPARGCLPMRTRTLPQAELVHRSLISILGQGQRVDCPELVGLDEQGQPLTGHQHAHILPLALESEQHLDHVLIWAPMGLGAMAQRAVRRLDRTWTKGGVGELRLSLVGQGGRAQLCDPNWPLGVKLGTILGGSQHWRSLTPFVAPRYVKRGGRNTLEGQIQEELRSRGLPSAVVRLLPWDTQSLSLRHMVRTRRKQGAKPPPVDIGYAIELSFEEPVRGPICLGYGAHFGLGLFQSEEV